MIIDSFIEKANSKLDLPAIIYDNKSYTYGQLKELVWNYASYFQNELKIKKDQCIVVWFDPSVEFIATILGLYCIGAYYLPIHEDFTLERKKFLISESDKDFMLTNFDIREDCIHFINVKYVKKSDPFLKIEGNYAYRIYTSGSTGEPKGVQITQKNLNYILDNINRLFPCVEGDSHILKTPFSFDVSIVEIFGWILGEARLFIPSGEKLKLFSTLADDIINNQITHLTISPTMINAFIPLVSADKLKEIGATLKYIILASEELPVKTANYLLEIFPNCNIINAYGPTETTVYCTYYVVNKKLNERVPIGKPFHGVEIYLENHAEYDFPELLISGEGCSQGYWKNPTKNVESFIEINGKKYYRTGDLVEKLSDDNLVFRGRIDSQIQINGIRTEIGEIEYLISKIDPIVNVAIAYVNKNLLCFYSTKIPMSGEKVNSLLKSSLPSYMMPNFIYNTEIFPITLNGKIDKKSLIEKVSDKKNSEANQNKLQSDSLYQIKCAFADVFGHSIELIKDETNFFYDLGGNSLKQMVLLTELEKIFNREFDATYLSMYQTPIDIANQLFQNTIDSKNNSYEELLKYELDSQIKMSNNQILKKTNRVEISRYQRNYIENDFNEILSIMLPIDNVSMWISVHKNLNYILKKSDALSSVIVKERGIHFLKNQFEFRDFYIPTFNFPGGNDKLSVIEDRIDFVVKNHISQNKFNNMLFRCLFINANNKKFLYFAVSHLICDLGSINLLKNLLLSHSPKITGSFFDYIKFTRAQSDIKVFKNFNKPPLLELFPETKIIPSQVKNRIIVSEISEITINNKTTEELIFEANYILSNLFSNFGLVDSYIVISTILSIKDYDGGIIFNTIGDFHSSFAFTYIDGENFDSYKQRCLEILSVLKSGNQLQIAIEKSNDVSFNQRFRKSQNLKTDFLGIIHDSELCMIYKEAIQFKTDFLNWLQSGRIRINLFIHNNKLYAIWLNEPRNLQEKLENNSITYYDISKEDWS